MEYSGQYLYPPRPSEKVSSTMLGFFDKQRTNGVAKYITQIKKNGTCSVTIISPDKKVQCWTRHKEAHKAWTPSMKTLSPMIDVSSGWTVFVSELLHSKGTGSTDTQYIFDILVYDNNYMVGSTFGERQNLLMDLFSSNFVDETVSHNVITNKIWLAKNHTSGFKQLFDNITSIEDEGVVIKEWNAKLDFCSRELANSNWQFKSRKATKNYSF